MNITIIRAIGVALIGGLAAFLAFGPGAPHGAQLFSLLLGWTSYSRFGGKLDGFKRSILHSLAGVALALAAVAIAAQHASIGRTVDFAIWAAAGVAVTLVLLFLATKLPLLSDFGALLLGYAAIAGTAGGLSLDAFLSPSIANPALGVLISLLLGAFLACGADMLTDALEMRLPDHRGAAA